MPALTVHPRRTAAALFLTASLALTGCGGSDDEADSTPTTSTPSPSDAPEPSTDDALAAAGKQLSDRDFRVAGTTTDDGTELEVDLSFVADDATGTVTADGDEIDLLSVDEVVYFRAGSDFWTEQAGAEAAQMFADKWIVGGEDFDDFAGIVSRDTFAEETLEPEGTVTQEEDETVDGVDCTAFEDGDGGVLYLAKDDSRPIRIADDETGDTVTFTYDDLEQPKKPAAGDIVDLADLQG